VSDAVLDEGRIVFATMIPEGNACQYGGISYLMELDINSGGAMTTATFDTNGDGQENNQDLLTLTYSDPNSGNSTTTTEGAAGLEISSGTIKTPSLLTNGNNQSIVYNTSGAGLGSIGNSGSSNGGRLSWQQLQ
jgi:type IV pilus assembly protein PilY1